MRHAFLSAILILSIIHSMASSCSKSIKPDNNAENNDTTTMKGVSIIIRVNTQIFKATLLNNGSAKAFQQILPLTCNMIELNGNEKYFDLPKSLVSNPTNVATIQNGDLMLYGSNTLVLFYKTFSTSYNYTKLGRIHNASQLAAALGTGNITITFELE